MDIVMFDIQLHKIERILSCEQPL